METKKKKKKQIEGLSQLRWNIINEKFQIFLGILLISNAFTRLRDIVVFKFSFNSTHFNLIKKKS